MPDRFGNLEIPADRQLDLAFLDGPLSLPRPLPFEEHGVAAYVGGRVYVPGDGDTRDRVVVYDLVRSLVPLNPGAQEEAWRQQRAGALAALATQVRGQVPVRLLTDVGAMNAARDAVRSRLPSELPDRHRVLPGSAAHTDASAWLRVVGHARLLRLADKLYDLQTLHEYATRFAKAVDAEVMAKLAALPLDAPPERHLEVIAQNLDRIHPKARSPLRNKMDTTRVVLGGVTLLPLYLGPAAALFDRYAERLGSQLRLDALGSGA